MAKARARAHAKGHHGKTIAPHIRGGRGKCPHCGAWHDRSQHWSHAVGADMQHSYDRTERPQGPHAARGHVSRHAYKKPAAAPKARKRRKVGAKRRATHRVEQLKPLTAAQRLRMGREYPARKHTKAEARAAVAAYRASPEYVARHGRPAGGKRKRAGGKKHRSPAQMAATARMLAARKKKLGR